MAHKSAQIPIFCEIGEKKVFASAVDWPGWSRSGRDEATAINALLASGPRYQQAIASANLDFVAPADLADLLVTQRLPGTPTTDFGAPEAVSEADRAPIDEEALARSQAILQACWATLATAVQAADDKELRKGPRGGGRDVDGIVRHVVDAHRSYLRQLGWKPEGVKENDLLISLATVSQATAEALSAAAAGQLPKQGPRGGVRWQPRQFVRRAAWHILDHAWEIEDRIIPD